MKTVMRCEGPRWCCRRGRGRQYSDGSRMVARMPKCAHIVAAMDADEDGGKLADMVREAYQLTGRDDLVFVTEQPVGFKDWNDQLRAKPHCRSPK